MAEGRSGRMRQERQQIEALADFLVANMKYDRGVAQMVMNTKTLEEALRITSHLLTPEEAVEATGATRGDVARARGERLEPVRRRGDGGGDTGTETAMRNRLAQELIDAGYEDVANSPYFRDVEDLSAAVRWARAQGVPDSVLERATTERQMQSIEQDEREVEGSAGRPSPNTTPLGPPSRQQLQSEGLMAEPGAGVFDTLDPNWVSMGEGLFVDTRDGAIFEQQPDGTFLWLGPQATNPDFITAAGGERHGLIGGFDDDSWQRDATGQMRRVAGYRPDLSADEAMRRGAGGDRLASRLGGGDMVGRTQAVAQANAVPIYREFDQWRQFAGLSPEQTAQVNQALIAAGALDENSKGYRPDVWTLDSARAMSEVMAIANSRGETWDLTARALAENAPEDDELARQRARNPFIVPVYREPDMATLRQAVRRSIAAELGRDPEDWELALLTKPMSADYRAAYNADVSAARITHEAGNHALANELDSAGGGTVRDVDPIARMQERLLSTYANEIDAEQAEDARVFNTQLFARSAAGMEGLVR